MLISIFLGGGLILDIFVVRFGEILAGVMVIFSGSDCQIEGFAEVKYVSRYTLRCIIAFTVLLGRLHQQEGRRDEDV